jgi:hypothetical protein
MEPRILGVGRCFPKYYGKPPFYGHIMEILWGYHENDV